MIHSISDNRENRCGLPWTVVLCLCYSFTMVSHRRLHAGGWDARMLSDVGIRSRRDDQRQRQHCGRLMNVTGSCGRGKLQMMCPNFSWWQGWPASVVTTIANGAALSAAFHWRLCSADPPQFQHSPLLPSSRITGLHGLTLISPGRTLLPLLLIGLVRGCLHGTQPT